MNQDSQQSDALIIWETPLGLMLVIILITPVLVALSSMCIVYNLVLMHLPGFHQAASRGHAITRA